MSVWASRAVRDPVLVARKKSCRWRAIHGAIRSSESPYRAAVSIWLTPYRSSTSSARSASAWLARARAAAPKSVTLLTWPGLSNGRRSIIAAPPVAAADYLAKMLPEPGEDLLPPVHRRGLAIVRAVDGEEGVPRVLVRMELEGLGVLPERLFGLFRVVRRGARVLHTEQPEQGDLEVLGEVDRRDGLARRQLFGLGHDAAAVAVDRGVEPTQRAGGQVRLAAARAIADDPDLAVEVRQGAQVVDGTLDISHRAIVRHAAGRADAGAVLLRRRLSLAEVQVR